MGILALPPSGIITDNDGIVIGRSSDGRGYLLTGGTEGQVPVVQGDGTIAYGAAGASSLSELDDWAANTLTVPGALTVRQAGGVAGTDEVQIYHDGTDAYLASQSGDVYITTAGNNSLFIDAPGGAYYQFKNDTYQYAYAGHAWKFYAGGGGTQQLVLDINKNDVIFYQDIKPLGRKSLGSYDYGFSQLVLHEQSSDPTDPNEGHCILWQSDGTGSGDDGDIMIKITAGGVTKTATLIDFSAV